MKPATISKALGFVPKGMLGKLGLGILLFFVILIFELLIGL